MTTNCVRCGREFESRDIPFGASPGTSRYFGKALLVAPTTTLVPEALCGRCRRRTGKRKGRKR